MQPKMQGRKEDTQTLKLPGSAMQYTSDYIEINRPSEVCQACSFYHV